MVTRVGSEADFEKLLDSSNKANKLVVVDFFAEWCGPCKVLAPKLEELSQIYRDIVFLKVDVDALEGLAQRYQISAMPTLVLIKGGEKVGQVVGANLPALKKEIETHSKSPSLASA